MDENWLQPLKSLHTYYLKKQQFWNGTLVSVGVDCPKRKNNNLLIKRLQDNTILKLPLPFLTSSMRFMPTIYISAKELFHLYLPLIYCHHLPIYGFCHFVQREDGLKAKLDVIVLR